MKIFIADPIAEAGIAFLKKAGWEVVKKGNAAIEESIRDAVALIVRSETQVTAALLAQAPLLRIIGRAGVGFDNIDVAAATERGIVVVNAPSGNTIATTELTFTHLLCAARPVVQAAMSLREGKWERKAFIGQELFKKTLGIVGIGRIGSELALRARAFGMHTVGYDPFLTPERSKTLGIESLSLEDLLRQSDFVTVHVPLTKQTTGMIGETELSYMKQGACLINCARGGIIDEKALLAALQSGHIRSAGLDVFEQEPLAPNSPWRNLPNCILTPHLGASTHEAQEGVGIEIAEEVGRFLRGIPVINAINTPRIDSRTFEILLPYRRLGEQLAPLLQRLAPAGTSRLKITYSGTLTAWDLAPLTNTIEAAYLRPIYGSSVNEVNAPHKMRQLGIGVEVIQQRISGDHTDLIQLEAISTDASTSLAGSIFGPHAMPRIVSFNEYKIEATLGHHLLIVRNEDRPGVLGTLCMLLGNNQINIANMALSRNSQKVALTLLELDTPLPADALAEIKKLPAILSAEFIENGKETPRGDA